MTTDLRDLMSERADALDPPDLDPGALMAAGDRRLRRRRLAGAGGGALAVVVLAGAASLALADARDEGPVAGGEPATPLVWAQGSVLHTGSGTVDLRTHAVALVQGRSGFVFADREGDVHTVVDGEVLPVGRFPSPGEARFVSDGDLVAWVDASDEGPAYMVVDLSEGNGTGGVALPVSAHADAVSPVERELGDTATIAAIDGGSVYLQTAGGVDVWRPFATGDEITPVPVPAGTSVTLLDVKAGVFHYLRMRGSPARKDEAYVVGPDLSSGTPLDSGDGMLSPDGTYLISLTADEHTVVDTVTGAVRPFDAGRYGYAVGYHWLDDDTYAALALVDRDSTAVDLLRCEVVAGSCTTEVEQLPAADVVLPAGQTW